MYVPRLVQFSERGGNISNFDSTSKNVGEVGHVYEVLLMSAKNQTFDIPNKAINWYLPCE